MHTTYEIRCSRDFFRFFFRTTYEIRLQQIIFPIFFHTTYEIRQQKGTFPIFFPYNIRNQTAPWNFSDFSYIQHTKSDCNRELLRSFFHTTYEIRLQQKIFTVFFPYNLRNQTAAWNFSDFSYIQHTKSDCNRELLRSFFHTTYEIRLQQKIFTVFFPYNLRNQTAAGNFSDFFSIQHTKSDCSRKFLRFFFHTTYEIRLQQGTFPIFFHTTYEIRLQQGTFPIFFLYNIRNQTAAGNFSDFFSIQHTKSDCSRELFRFFSKQHTKSDCSWELFRFFFLTTYEIRLHHGIFQIFRTYNIRNQTAIGNFCYLFSIQHTKSDCSRKLLRSFFHTTYEIRLHHGIFQIFHTYNIRNQTAAGNFCDLFSIQHTKSDCSRKLLRFFSIKPTKSDCSRELFPFFPYNIRNQTAAGNFSDFFPYNIRNQTAAGNFSDFFPYNIRNQTAP